MKRYLIFRGHNAYPAGGWKDLMGSTDMLCEAWEALAKSVARNGSCDWYQIVDSENGEIVDKVS